MSVRPTSSDIPSPEPSQSRPPGSIIAAVVLLSLLSLGLLALAVAAIATTGFSSAGLPIVVAMAIVLVLVAVALWQGRPGSRYAGLAVGLLLFVYGTHLAGRGESPSLELMVGIAISVLVLTRKSRAWTARP